MKYMKYSFIEIRPNLDGGWYVRHDNSDKADRHPRKEYVPHSLGFFYFPRKWGVKNGMAVLIQDMIKRREKEIARLKKDIKLIRKVKLPN
jgi:hypothetical protein